MSDDRLSGRLALAFDLAAFVGPLSPLTAAQIREAEAAYLGESE